MFDRTSLCTVGDSIRINPASISRYTQMSANKQSIFISMFEGQD